MGRPSKWKSPTVAIRVPSALAAKLVEQACQWEAEQERSFVQNSEDELLDEIVNRVLARCTEEGVDPKILLLHLKEKEVIEFLAHYSKQQRWQFIVALMDSME